MPFIEILFATVTRYLINFMVKIWYLRHVNKKNNDYWLSVLIFEKFKLLLKKLKENDFWNTLPFHVTGLFLYPLKT